MRSFLITVGSIAVMVLIIPLWVLGATGSWRHALHALRAYLRIMGAIIVVGGLVGLSLAIAEHGADLITLLR